jgi:hypothetical protein
MRTTKTTNHASQYREKRSEMQIQNNEISRERRRAHVPRKMKRDEMEMARLSTAAKRHAAHVRDKS